MIKVNKMSGPWYQISGPEPNQVRMDQLKKGIEKYKLENKQWHIRTYIDILKEVITDDIKFGSWRGYATFGIQTKIKNSISEKWDKKILEYEKSITIFNTSFKKVLLNYLYRPDGRIAKKILEKY
jgi:hypothetical protein